MFISKTRTIYYLSLLLFVYGKQKIQRLPSYVVPVFINLEQSSDRSVLINGHINRRRFLS